MLISPLMGPILGGTFGIVIGYKQLWQMGIINEIIGLDGVPVDVVGASADAAACWAAIEGSAQGLLFQWHGGLSWYWCTGF